MIMVRNRILILVLSIFFTQSCSNIRREIRLEPKLKDCGGMASHFDEPPPTIEKVLEYISDPILNTRYSPKSIRIATAYGLTEDLRNHILMSAKYLSYNQKQDELMKLEINIIKKINIILIDISSMEAEMSCSIDRLSELYDQMTDKELKIVKNYTRFAILISAAAAVIDGLTVYDNFINQKIIIMGGLMVAMFDYLAYNADITIEYRPSSSILREIWHGTEKSENFSTGLWFLLTKKIPMGDKEQFLTRDKLKQRWIDSKFLGEDGKEREKLIEFYFGSISNDKKPNIYSTKNIHDRREMLSQIRTLISLFEKDVRALSVEFMKN